jgi:ABC-type polysaccharide/polyol phosphate transport system ATPase subunit
MGRLRHLLAPGRPQFEHGLWALRDVSFAVEQGEAFGVIGSNGSGKSTLLQMIAGVLRPTSGTVEVQGRLSALLELGSGFSPEFTGRENVFLNAAILGLSQAETEQRFAQIERFAEIGDFIDQPVRIYSTGMVLRLAFAVSAHVDPEVLIVDEALAVGDIAFRQRCMRRIHDLRARGTTILFVSHEISDVKALCKRCAWLDRGVLREIGESDEIAAHYLSSTIEHKAVKPAASDGFLHPPAAANVSGSYRYGDGRATISAAGVAETTVTAPAHMALRIQFHANAELPAPIVGFLVRNGKGEDIFGTNTAREDYPMTPLEKGDGLVVAFHLTAPELAPGHYSVSVGVANGDIDDYAMCDYVEDAIEVDFTSTRWSGTGYMKIPCAGISVHRA